MMKHLFILTLLFCSSTKAGQLRDFISQSIDSHPSVISELTGLDIAQSRVELAAEQYFPTLGLSVDSPAYTSTSSTAYSNDAVTTLSLKQPIYTWGRLSEGANKAQYGYEAQAFSVEEVKLQLAQQVVNTWGEWIGAAARIEVLESSLQKHQDLRLSVNRRAEKGASSPSDVRLSEARLSQTKAQLESAKLERDLAKVRLSQLVGDVDFDMERPLSENFSQVEKLNLVVEKVLVNHPTILRLKKEISQSESEAAEKKASFLPELFVRAEYQNGGLVSGEKDATRIVFGLQSNFGAGFSVGIESRLADQSTQSLRNQLLDTERQIAENILLARAKLKNSNLRLQTLEESLDANRDMTGAFNRQYLAGRRSWIEVMNTARELSQAELELANLKIEKVVTEWNLALLVLGLKETLSAQ